VARLDSGTAALPALGAAETGALEVVALPFGGSALELSSSDDLAEASEAAAHSAPGAGGGGGV
jgi:hypothetical protein